MKPFSTAVLICLSVLTFALINCRVAKPADPVKPDADPATIPAPATSPANPFKPDAVRKIQVDVEVYGQGNTKDTRYHLPIENGTVEVAEYASQKAIFAHDDIAGFTTADNRKGGRTVYFSIKGSKHTTEYIDLNGDGILDAMIVDPATAKDRWFIAVDGRWLEVGREKVGFSIGDSRTARAASKDPNKFHDTYTFKESEWVKN